MILILHNWLGIIQLDHLCVPCTSLVHLHLLIFQITLLKLKFDFYYNRLFWWNNLFKIQTVLKIIYFYLVWNWAHLLRHPHNHRVLLQVHRAHRCPQAHHRDQLLLPHPIPPPQMGLSLVFGYWTLHSYKIYKINSYKYISKNN